MIQYLLSSMFNAFVLSKYLVDASWDSRERDSAGNLVPSPTAWPNGIDIVIEYVHSKGLGFGLYGDKGAKDCAGNPYVLYHA